MYYIYYLNLVSKTKMYLYIYLYTKYKIQYQNKIKILLISRSIACSTQRLGISENYLNRHFQRTPH